MPDDAEKHPDPLYAVPRRLAMFFKLIEEGLIVNKPPEQVTEADFDIVDGRLLLEHQAAALGVSIDQMFSGWEQELENAHAFETVEGLMKWLHDDPASKSAK